MDSEAPRRRGSGAVVGYARVSSGEQHLDRQLATIGPVDRVYTDKRSGRNRAERPGLATLMDFVREGDRVRVASLDRFARSVIDLVTLVQELNANGVAVEFVTDGLVFEPGRTDPRSEFQLHLLAAFAQFERRLIAERQREGIEVAKANGVYGRKGGRAKRLDDTQIAQARHRIAQGVPKAVVARDLGCSRQALYDALNRTGAYAPTPTNRPGLVGATEVELPLE